jgi:phosphotransferase system HPr-like phosphotransfer protein
MLGAECGSTLCIRTEGAKAAEASDALRKLVEEKFGEE